MYCDNMGVVGAWQRGRSANPPTNEILKQLEQLCVEHDITITMLYIDTSENPAEAVSRGEQPEGMTALSWAFKLPAGFTVVVDPIFQYVAQDEPVDEMVISHPLEANNDGSTLCVSYLDNWQRIVLRALFCLPNAPRQLLVCLTTILLLQSHQLVTCLLLPLQRLACLQPPTFWLHHRMLFSLRKLPRSVPKALPQELGCSLINGSLPSNPIQQRYQPHPTFLRSRQAVIAQCLEWCCRSRHSGRIWRWNLVFHHLLRRGRCAAAVSDARQARCAFPLFGLTRRPLRCQHLQQAGYFPQRMARLSSSSLGS